MLLSNSSKLKVIILTALIIILLLATSLNAVIAIASVVLTYVLFRDNLSLKIFDTVYIQAVLALVLYVALLQATTLAVWLFARDFPLDACVPAVAVLLGISFLWQKYYLVKSEPAQKAVGAKKLFNKHDLASVGLGLLLVIAVTVPPMRDAPSFADDTFVASIAADFISTGTDDSNHMGMISDRLRFNRGVLYQTDVVSLVALPSSISSYPSGWHSANAALIKAMNPDNRVGGDLITAYALSKLFWFFVLVFCFSRFTLYLSRVVIDRVLPGAKAVTSIWLIGSLGFFSYYVLLGQFKEGFYSFIPELIVVLLIGMLLVQLSYDKATTGAGRLRTLTPIIVLLASSALSWLLIFPPLLLATVILLFSSASIKGVREEVFNGIREASSSPLLITLSISAVVLQAFLLTRESSRTLADGLTEPGAIAIPSDWYYLFIIVGVLLAFAIVRKASNILESLALLTVSLLGFSFLIFLFQNIKTGQADYYYYKTLITVMIITTPIAIVGWLRAIEGLTRHQPFVLSIVFTLGCIFLLPLAIGLNPTNTSNITYLKGIRSFTSNENAAIFNTMEERSLHSRGARDVIFYSPGTAAYNLIGSTIMRSNQRLAPCHDAAYGAAINDKFEEIALAVKKCPEDGRDLLIFTKPETFELLRDEIANKRLDSRIQLRVVH